MSELTTYRAARGLKMYIPACDVTFPPMYTKRHTHPILSGLKSLQLQHRVDEAEWDDTHSNWRVIVHNLKDGTTAAHSFDFVITAIGRFNQWKLPNYPGLNDYQGHLRHTSNWDVSFDPTDKKVAVIGNGASGIQVVPNLQPVAKHVTHFVRNPTWIATSWAGDERSWTRIYQSRAGNDQQRTARLHTNVP